MLKQKRMIRVVKKTSFGESHAKSSNERAENPASPGARKESSNLMRAEKINEFSQIMTRRFEENLNLKQPLRVNLGIDLGTSYSKIVWRFGENAFPLCFGSNASNLTDYLAPSIVVFNDAKIACGFETITNEAEKSNHQISNFKICLMCESSAKGDCNIQKCSLTNWQPVAFAAEIAGQEAHFVTSFYLAKLLTQTRRAVRERLEQDKGFSSANAIRWSANFSVPESFTGHSEIYARFAKVIKTAWLMSDVFGEYSQLNDCQDVFDCYLAACDLETELTAYLQADGRDFDCFTYSEIGAAMASITLSRTSEEGLYAFVDIGAGTVDASLFRFFRENGEAHRPPYAAEVFKIGAANIEKLAEFRFAQTAVGWLKRVKEELKGKTATIEARELLQPIVENLVEAADEVGEDAKNCLIDLFKKAYEKENSLNSWQELRLVLGGGGANLRAYENAAREAFTLKDSKLPKPPRQVVLNVPHDFKMQGLPPSEFHRFAVAYGLSHNIVDLPLVVSAKEVAPVKAKPQHQEVDWYAK